MISNLIESLLQSINVNLITDIFIITIIILLFLSIVWTKKDKHHEFTSYAPTLLTSIGILGTFTGIVVGLLSFNVSDIDGSIEHLLSGLKVAFITSLVGMSSSIVLKFLSSSNFISPPEQDKLKEDVTAEDLYEVMDSQNKNIIKVQELLSDSADSSLIGQIKLMRSDMTDNTKITNKNLENIVNPLKQIEENQHKEIELLQKPLEVLLNIDQSVKLTNELLNTLQEGQTKAQDLFDKFTDDLKVQLESFAELLSKSATQQIIEALKDVIKEFNEKLTEQFGQNFKELNTAVKDLVLWQDNYKGQLSDMEKQFNLSVNSMSDMEKSIELISTSSKSIPDSMSSLETIISTNQHQVDELAKHLEAFKDIRDKAVEAVPEIRTQINTTINGIQEASKGLIDGVTSSTDKISSVMVQSADDFANNVSQTNAALVESSNTLTESSTDIKEQLNMTIQDINKYLREMIENLSVNSKEISTNFKGIGVTLETEITNANKHMVENYKSVSDSLTNSSSNITKEFETSSKKITESLSNTSVELQKSIESLSQEQLKQTSKILSGLDKSIEKTIQDTSSSLSSQIEAMDKVAEQEINNVMNAMGKSLGSITQKFTDDYKSLVNEMQQVIESNR